MRMFFSRAKPSRPGFLRRFALRRLGETLQRCHHLLHGHAQAIVVIVHHVHGYRRHHNGQDDANEQHIELYKAFPVGTHGVTSNR